MAAFGIALGDAIHIDVLQHRFRAAPTGVALVTGNTRAIGEWYSFSAPHLPDIMRSSVAQFWVQLDANMRVLSVHAKIELACATLGKEIIAIVAAKYTAVETDPGEVPATLPRGERFVEGSITIKTACEESRLYLSYERIDLIKRELIRYQAHQARLEAELAELAAGRRRAQANQLALGSKQRLLGGLGLKFADTLGNHPVDASIDLPGRFAQQLPPPFTGAQLRVKVGPEGNPYHLDATRATPKAEGLFKTLAAALTTKYGDPYSGSTSQRLFRINGDIVRLSYAATNLRVVFIDRAGAMAGRKRLAARQLLTQQKAKADWDERTRGL